MQLQAACPPWHPDTLCKDVNVQNRAAVSVAILGLAIVSALAAQTAQEGGPWSPPISGVQARFSFGTGDLSYGTRITRVFLELRNISDVLNPIYLLYDSYRSIKAELYDSAGKPVAVSPHAASIWSPGPFLICLPYNSILRLDVTAIGYGVPKDRKALIGLYSGVWVIEKTDSSEYLLGGTFAAERPTKPTKERIWTGRIEIPKAVVDALKK